jgi:hypothetical protein
MPFVATCDGERVLPYEAAKADTLLCPVCDDEMTCVTSHHRHGSFVAPHFRHQTNDDCAGESATHLRMKSIALSKLAEAYPEATVAPEEPVGSHRADILVSFPEPRFPYGHGIAVEVQYRNDSKNLLKTDQNYYDVGYSVLWLTQQHFDEYDVTIDHIQPVWPNALPQLKRYDGLDWPLEESTPTVKRRIRLPPDYFEAHRATLRDAFDTGRSQRSNQDWPTHTQVWLSKPRHTTKRSLQLVENPSGSLYLKLSKGQQGKRPEFVHLPVTSNDISALERIPETIESALGTDQVTGEWHDLTQCWLKPYSDPITAWLTVRSTDDNDYTLLLGKKTPYGNTETVETVFLPAQKIPAIRQFVTEMTSHLTKHSASK